jgi:hypothetical protein
VGLLNFGAHTPRSFVPNREAIRRFIRSAHPAPRRTGTPQQNVFPYHSGRQASASTPSASPGSGQGRSRAFIAEVVPGRVYALSGFEFTEYYFVVSEDGRELISIDAGTRPDFARATYEALRAHAPGLPELTTVFITHSHWDHIGGHAYFRSLNPNLRFYARTNYQEELAREFNAPGILTRS